YRSTEEYVYVRGRGRGRYVCEECGIRWNLTKHMKSKAHGKRCPEGTTPGPVQCELEADEGGESAGGLLEPELLEEHQFSDAEDTDVDDEGDEQTSCSSSLSKSTSLSKYQSESCEILGLSNPGWELQPKAPVSMSPRKPNHYGEASSPKTTKSLLTLEPSAGQYSPSLCSLSPGLQMSPALPQSPPRDMSPLHCPSPRLRLSPIRALSPTQPSSPGWPLQLTVGGSVTIHQQTARSRDATEASPGRLSPKNKSVKTHSPQGRRSSMCQFWPMPTGCLSRNTEPREGQRVLSHLPLHSQPQVLIPSLSLTVPIGGLQIVQPQSSMLMRNPSRTHSVAQMTVTLLSKQKTAGVNLPHVRNQLIVFTEPSLDMSSRSDASSDEDKEQTHRGVQTENVSKKEATCFSMTSWKSISQRTNKRHSRSPKKTQAVNN
ncbi:hypothetical protein DNTS_020910, partial [Danionella cerebrum]